MPVAPRYVDFTTGEPVRIVEPLQRIDSLNTVDAPAGLYWGIKLGNNPVVPRYSGDVTMQFSDTSRDSDVADGVTIYPAAPAPNQGIWFMVSFT